MTITAYFRAVKPIGIRIKVVPFVNLIMFNAVTRAISFRFNVYHCKGTINQFHKHDYASFEIELEC